MIVGICCQFLCIIASILFLTINIDPYASTPHTQRPDFLLDSCWFYFSRLTHTVLGSTLNVKGNWAAGLVFFVSVFVFLLEQEADAQGGWCKDLCSG